MKITIETQFKNKSPSEQYVETKLWMDDSTNDYIVASTTSQDFEKIVDACKRIWQRMDTQVALGDEASRILNEAGTVISKLLSSDQIQHSKRGPSIRTQYFMNYDSPLDLLTHSLESSQAGNKNAYIHILCHDSELEELPWELLTVPIEDSWVHIGLMPDVRIVRMGRPNSRTEATERPIECKILNVDMSNTRIEGLDSIRAASLPDELIARSINDSDITWDTVESVLKGSDTYTVFHYDGHGRLNPYRGNPELILRSNDRNPDEKAYIDTSDLISAMRARDTRQLRPVLAVLMCCDVGVSGRWQGLGVELLDKGILATISMQAPIQDEAAKEFTNSLYEELSGNVGIAVAIAKARQRIKDLDDPLCRLDWWIPVLHTRSPQFAFAKTPYPTSNEPGDITRLLQELTADPKFTYSDETYLMDELSHCHEIIAEIWENAAIVTDSLTTQFKYALLVGTEHQPQKIRTAYDILLEILPDLTKVLGVRDPFTLSVGTLMCLHACQLHYGDDEGKVLADLGDLHLAQAKVLPMNHPLALITRYLTAYITGELGDHQQALTHYETLLPLRVESLGANHPNTFNTRAAIARCIAELNCFEGAIALFEQLLSDQVTSLRENHPNTLITRSWIAYYTGELGNHQRALELYQQLLPEKTQHLGPNHPSTLATRHQIAQYTGELGNHQRALELHQQLLPEKTQHLGPDHPSTLITRSVIAYCTGELGNRQQALELYQQLLPDQVTSLRENHPNTLITRSWIAYYTGMLGNHQQALELHQQLLPDETQHLGPNHPSTLATRHQIAYYTGMLGRYDEALELYEQLLPDETQHLGPNHPSTLATRHQIAYYTGMLGRHGEALELYQQLLPDET